MSLENAEKGKAYSAGLADKAMKRGRMDEAGKEALLSQITPSTDDNDYAGADLIVEAVFEDIALKEKVIPETFKQLAPGGIYGSNTSTLPISLLAENCPEPDGICTYTGKPRPYLLFEKMARLRFEDYRSIVVRSHQLSPGVGGFKPAALLGALDAVKSAAGPILLTTACSCHGVMNACNVTIWP